MSLELIIIPIEPESATYAETVKESIQNAVPSNIIIDTDYNLSLTKKLIKYKKTGNDIITVTSENASKNNLTVRYGDKGSKPELIDLDDFIELVKSYYEEGTKDKEEVEAVRSVSVEAVQGEIPTNEGGCQIM